MPDTPISRGRGNTNPPRSRNWTLTINNYTSTEKKDFINLNANYIFQCEKGEKETPHIQGTIAFKNARTLTAMKKLFPRAHFEVCKDIEASLKYCSKTESRIEGPFCKGYDLDKYIGTYGTTQSVKTKVDFFKELHEKRIKSDIEYQQTEEFKNDLNNMDLGPMWNINNLKNWKINELN